MRGTTKPLIPKATLVVNDQTHLTALRNEIKTLATELGMSLVSQTKLVTAASELGRNMIRYGHGGEVSIVVRQQLARKGIQLTFTDQGPGIASLEDALRDGFSTGQGLGLGLPGTKRLVDEFDIKSVAGQGTTVSVTKW